MSRQLEFRLSGTGGQGLITSGIILAEAAVKSGKNATQTQSYGPEARGGASKSEVIISEGEIYYPKVEQADVLLVMSEEAYKKYKDSVKKGGILLMDSSLIEEKPEIDGRVYQIPLTEIAREQVGRSIVANIVALGAIVAITGVVSREDMEEAVFERFPKAREINARALAAGIEAAEKLKTGC